MPDAGTEPFSREALLGAFADCAWSQAKDFASRASELANAAVARESALSTETESRVRASWESAIDRWQELELFQFGPAAMSSQPGGRELRNEIYAWPQFNRCLIEQLIVNKVYTASNFGEQFVNARGLGAVEYALFYAGADNACPSSNPINRAGTWGALVSSGLPPAKASYARAAAADVLRHAETLVAAWDPGQGNFRNDLARAGGESTVYATQRAGFNAVSDALILYLDTEVKDTKLAGPLGLVDCGLPICPVESPFAGRSKAHVRNNLIGFRKLFSGCADGRGLGFDDLLADVGQRALSDDIERGVCTAIAAADAIEEPSLADAVASDPESVRALHTAVKAITDRLKTDFVTVLDLDLPVGAEDDND
jgi:predicted lipoprotein